MEFPLRKILIAAPPGTNIVIKNRRVENWGDYTLPLRSYERKIDATGTDEILLPVKGAGTIEYQCFINFKGGKSAELPLFLNAGTDIYLSEALPGGTEATTTLQDYIDVQIAASSLTASQITDFATAVTALLTELGIIGGTIPANALTFNDDILTFNGENLLF